MNFLPQNYRKKNKRSGLLGVGKLPAPPVVLNTMAEAGGDGGEDPALDSDGNPMANGGERVDEGIGGPDLDSEGEKDTNKSIINQTNKPSGCQPARHKTERWKEEREKRERE